MGLDLSRGEPITRDEIKEALKRMPNGKAEGPDQIPVEVWKNLGEKVADRTF